MTLGIRPRGRASGRYRVVFRGDGVAECGTGPGGNPFPAVAFGTGSVDEADPNLLHTELLVRCLGRRGGPGEEIFPDFVYQPGSDTLQGLGVTWQRIIGPQIP
jgi:hypothetical protein